MVTDSIDYNQVGSYYIWWILLKILKMSHLEVAANFLLLSTGNIIISEYE